jgi:hypothetical protein
VQLLHAVELLDLRLCLDVVSRFREVDNKLADRLRLLIDSLEYAKLIEILDTIGSKEITNI